MQPFIEGGAEAGGQNDSIKTLFFTIGEHNAIDGVLFDSWQYFEFSRADIIQCSQVDYWCLAGFSELFGWGNCGEFNAVFRQVAHGKFTHQQAQRIA